MQLRNALRAALVQCIHIASSLQSVHTTHATEELYKNGKDTTDIEYFKVSALRQHVSSRLIIVNVLEIPIQIQFGLEKSMTIANAKIQYNKDTIIFNVFSSSQSLITIRSKHGLAIRSESEHKNMYS